MSQFVELSHVIRDGLIGYPGFPPAQVRPWMTHEASRDRYDGQAEFTITEFSMVGNTGTYLDSPYHRDPGGADVSGLGIGMVAGLDGVVLDGIVGEDRAVRFHELPDLHGKAVLVRTGWSARYGTDEYWVPGPYLGHDALDAFLSAGVALVGVDFANVDDTTDPARPAHTRLLRAGVVIVEHLANLEALPAEQQFRFFAIPLAIEGAASSPVRAFAELG